MFKICSFLYIDCLCLIKVNVQLAGLTLTTNVLVAILPDVLSIELAAYPPSIMTGTRTTILLSEMVTCGRKWKIQYILLKMDTIH